MGALDWKKCTAPPSHRENPATLSIVRTTTSIVLAAVLSSALTAFFLSATDRTASARAFVPQDLGPADALVLTGKSELRLANVDGRLSWSNQPTSRAFSLGTVHVGRILEALLMSDKYARELEDYLSEQQRMSEQFEARYKQMLEKAGKIDEDSPEAPAAREEFEAFQREFTVWNESSESGVRAMESRHYQSAYADLREAVEVVADRRKIDLVMRFIPPADKITVGDTASITQQLMARTFLRLPDSIDMTDDVLTEMNLQAPKKD